MEVINGADVKVTNEVDSDSTHTHRIHVWYIYLHLVDFYGKLAGKYTSPMDPSWDTVYQTYTPLKTNGWNLEIPPERKRRNIDPNHQSLGVQRGVTPVILP